MNCARLMFLFLLRHVCSEEPEPVFKAEGGIIEMGYCFAMENMVVFRTFQEGDQLIGSSSNQSMPNALGANLQGRARLTDDYDMHGLLIGNLTHMDSGIYRTECWSNQTRVRRITHELSVCDMEVESKEIDVKEEGASIWCNSSLGLKGTSVRWYHEIYPSFKITLFLDSSVSLEPLVEVPGVLEVKENGTLLVLDNSAVKNNQNFYCLIIKDSKCVSFQIMYPLDLKETLQVFASQGDQVVLNCPNHGHDQHWNTPVGKITERTKKQVMYISAEPGDFSLVIPIISGEHSGGYSCLSSLVEIHYSLVLCSKKETQKKVCYEGSSISLACDSSLKNIQRVQWYRLELLGQHEIIQDSNDATISIPEGLRGRLTLSEDGFLMTISDLVMADSGEYWCVILQSDEYKENNKSYTETFDDTIDYSFDYADFDYLSNINACLLKIETSLTILVEETGRIGSADAVTPTEGIYTSVASSEGSNVAAYAAGGGVVGLLVVGAIVAGIIVKKKADASLTERQGAPLSTNRRSDIELKRDPGCTERLTHSDDVA